MLAANTQIIATMKKKRIISNNEHICLFCGKPEKEHIEGCEKYYQCDCKDAVEERRIHKLMDELLMKLPPTKYIIIKENVLYSKECNNENKRRNL